MPTAGKGTYRELLRQGEHLLRRRVRPGAAPRGAAWGLAALLLGGPRVWGGAGPARGPPEPPVYG